MKKISKLLLVAPFVLLLVSCGKKTKDKYYNVSFYNDDNTLIRTISVKDGETPIYDGETPTKKVELGYECEFLGWDSNFTEVHSDTKYTATYSDKVVKEEMKCFTFESTNDTCVIKGLKDDTLTSITVPNYVTSISEGAFSNCSSLKSITIPFVGDRVDLENKETLYPFGYIFGKTNYDGGVATTQYYGENPFTESIIYYIPSSLKEVIVTETSYIQQGAFRNCSNLENIIVSESITNIDSYAFKNCSNLENIEISNSVKKIDIFAFNGCTNLKNVYYDGTVEDWLKIALSSDTSTPMCHANRFYLLDNNGDIEYKENKYSLLDDLVIPNTVTSIGIYQFYGFEHLNGLTLSNSITRMDNYAFGGDSLNIDRLYYNGTIEDWCKISFENSEATPTRKGVDFYLSDNNGETVHDDNKYSKLSKLELPSTITSVGVYQFYGFKCIVDLIIPDNIKSLGEGAFKNCVALRNIEFSNSIGAISDHLFSDCNKLEKVYFKGTIEDWCTIKMNSDENANPMRNVPNFYLLDNNGDTEFNGHNYTLLRKLEIPETVTSLGNYQFYGLYSVEEVIIPNSITNLGIGVFKKCERLTSLEFSRNINTITDELFCHCNSICNIYYRGTIKDWCNIKTNNTFDSNLTVRSSHLYLLDDDGEVEYNGSKYSEVRNVKIDDNFTIRSYTFSYLDNIKIVDIGFVYKIESYAFYECFHLESVVIHYNEDISLRIIDSYAFYNSNYLDKVFFDGNESDWSKIQIGKNNDNLLNATRYYYSKNEPAEAGNYWHYVDGLPTIWE